MNSETQGIAGDLLLATEAAIARCFHDDCGIMDARKVCTCGYDAIEKQVDAAIARAKAAGISPEPKPARN